jgi:GNAT superfamily N-acetyltransferase
MDLTVRPLTPDLWPALEDLFGKNGAIDGCWCMYWRTGMEYRRRPREENREALRQIVQSGPPPGLLAFDGELPVGWCQLTPRGALPWLDRARFSHPVDDLPVWSISCFYVRRGHRRQGVASALVAAALEVAGRAGAPALEAYPVDTHVAGASSNIFTGTTGMFARAGFKTVVYRTASRPIMRYDFQTEADQPGQTQVPSPRIA